MYCIAGKNQCSVSALSYLLNRDDIDDDLIVTCVNKDDYGNDGWQPSLKRFATINNIKILELNELHKYENLFFFSLEFDKIIKTELFKSVNLFNFHFSLLPKYRGCHTNYLQIKNGEVQSGVTLHCIDNGIDSGDIIIKKQFNINRNDTAKDNYIILMNTAIDLFKESFDNIISGNFNKSPQLEKDATYYSRSFIDYKNEKINFNQDKINIHNEIRALIFPPFQYPKVDGNIIIKSIFNEDKIILINDKNDEKEY